VVVGPEFVTGSSEWKQEQPEMVLNMISTATMIQLGKVKGIRWSTCNWTTANWLTAE
jgi:N-acetylmuramic acid 6-phosphate (MurNAc-6-P) etherase